MTTLVGLLVSFLIFALIICVVAAIVVWILSNIPGMPPWARQVVWAIAGILILIWVLHALPAIEHLAG